MVIPITAVSHSQLCSWGVSLGAELSSLFLSLMRLRYFSVFYIFHRGEYCWQSGLLSVQHVRWAVEQWHRMGCRVEFVDLTLGVGECRVSPVRFEEPACLPPSASWPCIACRHMLNHLGLGHCQGRSWAQLWFKRTSVFGILLVSLPWIPAKSSSSYLVGCESIAGLLSLLLLLLLLFRSL